MAARYAEDLPGKHGPTGPPPPDRRAAAAWGITAQPLDLAVTGIACRLPGATDPAAFWALLSEGRRAITAIPEDRWATTKFDRPRPRTHEGRAHDGGAKEDAEASSARAAPGMAYSRAAGVLEDLWGFDAGFFGISAREAAQMDPQQRLVLELAWEAVEDACFAGGGFRRDPADPSGPGRTGVYVGAAAMDHALRFAADTGAIDSPFMTGNTLSIIANRVSHFFDFRGPSMVIDTACASSLTALHVAAGALARGEIDTAVVAGVNVLLQPHNFVGFCAAEMLSPSGRCRPFAEGADGYVRGEGAVVLVLRRRADALSAGQPVQAVLCASGIGTDGHKAGLTRPATAAQAALIEAVHTAAGLEHGQLAFAEAHGTGTPTGDPVEAEALARALGAVRWAAGLGPLPIGSVKGNIGHLEPAAGLAGVLKAILALAEGTLPASLGAETVSPKIAALESLCVARAALPLALQEAAEREPPAACVSSFGFGGANAHLVLRAASAAERGDEVPTPDREAALPPLVLSAATDAALAALAQRWRAHVAEAIDAPDALCAAIEKADGRRTRQAAQAVLAARKPTGLLKALDALADGRSDPRVTSCRAQTPEARGIALVFSGNGAQWGGMGQWLLTDPLGADRFNEAAAAISAAGGPDLAALMAAPDREERLQDSLAAQSLLWAQQVAAACSIVAQLEARGLAPRLVMGHSVGEVAAACAAGCLRLRDAARLIVNRACAVRPLRDSGAMAALLTDRDTAAALMAEVGAPDSLALAADNSPRSVTVSGDSAAVDALAAIARSRRIALRKLPVPFPYHAPALDGVEDALRAAAAGLAPQHGQLRLISTVTGARIAPVALTDDHWWRNARQPVRFREGVETAIAEGCGLFIEIGPRPVLGAYVRDCLSASSATGLCLSSEPGPGREDAATSPAALAAIAQGHVQASGDTACAARRPPHAGHAGLPRYPWQRRQYRAAPSASGGDLYGLVPLKSGRARSALLGHRDRAGCGPWLGSIDAARDPWLAQHRLRGRAVVPAAGFAAMAIEAAADALDNHASRQGQAAGLELNDLQIIAPCAVGDGPPLRSRITIEEDAATLRVDSAAGDSDLWRVHTRCGFRALGPGPEADANEGATTAAEPGWRQIDPDDLYRRLADLGLAYGPCFRRLQEITTDGLVVRGVIRPGTEGGVGGPLADADCFALHPAMLDSALHALVALLDKEVSSAARSEPALPFLPTYLKRLQLYRALDPGEGLAVEARITRQGRFSLVADLALRCLSDGKAIAQLTGLTLERASRGDVFGPPAETWRTDWIPLPGSAVAPNSGGSVAPISARPAPPRCLAELARRLSHALGPAQELEPAAVLLTEICRAVTPACEGETSVPIAPLSTVVPTLLADAPTRGLEVLAALSDPGGSARSTPPTGPRLEALRAGCMRAVAALLQYREGSPARVLAIGFDADALRDLAGLSGMGCVFAADPHLAAGPLNSLEQAPATAPILPDPGGATRPAVDFVLVAAPGGAPTGAALRGLLDRLDPDGVLIAAEPDPASDALVERVETVWADPADGSAAVHLRHLPLPDERLSARLLLATGAPRPAPPATPPTPPIVLLADGPGVDGLGAALGLRPRSMARPGALAGRTLVIAVSASDTEQALTAQLTLCRAIARRPVDKRPEAVIWLTANALDRAPQSAAPGTAAVDAGVAALRRVMANELPSIRWHLIDGLSPDDDTQRAGHRQTAQAASLVRRIADGADPDLLQEREIWLDGEGCPWAPRRSRALAPKAPARTEAQVLSAGDAGSLARLGWQPGRDPGPDALGAGEVRVRVEAAGVNFRDVMAALGRLPPRVLEGGLAGAGLGMEMAGTVIDAGRDTAFRSGDRVFGFAAGALASEVVTDHRLLGPLPEALSVSEAAALPAAYLTALYALETLARIRPGEQVLIHAATGGVGLAAAAVAQRQGAHVLATAGSTEKRRLAIALGAAEVFDSRDPGFADAVRATTGGVDVVLNSLAGPALRRGIECLAPFGRFIELGKQDIAENRTIALATFAENLSFHALDADRLLTTRPAAVRALLARLAADIAAERLPKLPVATFGADEADLAFALMKRAAHIGKIVIRPPTTRRSRAVPAPARIGQERRPAWIIAGGTGGLGLEIAEALVRRRKARVLLVARRSPRAQSRQRIEALQREGLAIETCRLDAADRAALEALARRIESDGETLEGLLHAAMVLHDTPIAQQTPAPVAAVLHAKVAVAKALAGLTAARPECRLVMLGSASALVGNPNQAAYAAANGALEGIARQCRADGRSAITLALGPVGDAGRLAADPTLRQRLEAHWAGQPGAGFLSAQTVVDAVLNTIADPGIGPVLPLLAAAAPPRAAGARHARAAARLAVFGEAAQSALSTAASQPATPVGGETERPDTAGSPIHTFAPATRHAVIQRRLRDAAAQVLRQPADEIDIDRPLSDIGFDSLMIVDLKLAAEEALHLPLSLDGVGHGESLKSLADRVAAEVAPQDGAPHEEAVALDAGRATSPAPPAGSGSSDDALLSALVERHAVGMPAQARARLVEIVGTSKTEGSDQGKDRPMTEAPRHA